MEYGFGIGDIPSTLNTYERTFHVRANDLDAGSTGTLDLHVGLADATQDLTQNTIRVRFTFTVGTIVLNVEEFVAGVIVGIDSAVIGDQGYGGTITVAITGTQVRIYYRGTLYVTYTATTMPGSQAIRGE